MDFFTNFLINEAHINSEIVIVLLTVPIIASIITFGRYIIGLKTFGVYVPLLLSFAFYILAKDNEEIIIENGLKFGILLSIITLSATCIVYLITKKIRLHYLSKVTILLSFIILVILICLSIIGLLSKTTEINFNPIAVCLIIIVSEEYMKLAVKKGIKSAVYIIFEGLILSSLSYLLLASREINNFILHNSFITFIAIIINIFIGSYKGLRISEFLRFKSILDTPNGTDSNL